MVRVTDMNEFGIDAAFMVDQELTIVSWNDAAQECLGYSEHEVVGQRCSEVMQINHAHGEPLCVPSCECVRCFRDRQGFTASSCYARHKDGEWVPVNVVTTVMPKSVRDNNISSKLTIVLLRGGEIQQDIPQAARTLQIFTFGRFGLATGGRSVLIEKWERKQALTLLKLLVARMGHVVSGEVLSNYLWPEIDERHGRKRLKVTIYALRRELRSAGIHEDVIDTVGEGYLLKREAVWVDMEAFECCVAAGAAQQSQAHWDDALRCYGQAQRLYRGEYFEENIHADWCAMERDRLREVYLEVLVSMAECHAACDRFASAASICRTIVVTDPCRESIHVALMEYLICFGHTDSAIAQYRQCQRILVEELGVEPMPETKRLFRQIISGEASAAVRKS